MDINNSKLSLSASETEQDKLVLEYTKSLVNKFIKDNMNDIKDNINKQQIAIATDINNIISNILNEDIQEWYNALCKESSCEEIEVRINMSFPTYKYEQIRQANDSIDVLTLLKDFENNEYIKNSIKDNIFTTHTAECIADIFDPKFFMDTFKISKEVKFDRISKSINLPVNNYNLLNYTGYIDEQIRSESINNLLPMGSLFTVDASSESESVLAFLNRKIFQIIRINFIIESFLDKLKSCNIRIINYDGDDWFDTKENKHLGFMYFKLKNYK